jgi:hypothetical protein
MNETWSLGVLIGLPLVILTILLSVALIVYCIQSDAYDAWMGTATGVVVLVCVVIGAAWGFYPYSAEYHKWVPKTGVVKATDKRIVSGGEGKINEKIVATYENGAQYGCNDTRCASVRKGDTLTLTCKRTWQYTGVDGYDCNFIELRKG